jgi:hypothetical protein
VLPARWLGAVLFVQPLLHFHFHFPCVQPLL